MKIRAAKVPNRELFWWLNILLFGILGVVLILALNSSVSVHALCARLLAGKGISALQKRILTPEVVELLLLYGKCFIWSYELVFCLSFLLRGSLSGLKSAFAIAVVFEAILLLVQFFFFLHGSFLIGNLAAILLGDFFSILIILIHERALI